MPILWRSWKSWRFLPPSPIDIYDNEKFEEKDSVLRAKVYATVKPYQLYFNKFKTEEDFDIENALNYQELSDVIEKNINEKSKNKKARVNPKKLEKKFFNFFGLFFN